MHKNRDSEGKITEIAFKYRGKECFAVDGKDGRQHHSNIIINNVC